MSQISADLFNYALNDKLAASDNYNAAIGAGLGVGALGFAPKALLAATYLRGLPTERLERLAARNPENIELALKAAKSQDAFYNSKLMKLSKKLVDTKWGRILGLTAAPVLGLAGLGYATYKAGQKSEHNKPFYQRMF